MGFNIIAVSNIQIKKDNPCYPEEKIKVQGSFHMLTFDRDEDLMKIVDIKYTSIKIEELRTKPEIIKQCKNIRALATQKTTATAKKICVKCAEKHASNKCPKGKNSTLKFANCKQTGHEASY